MTASGSCEPFFSDSVKTPAGELTVYRCSCTAVRNATRGVRSRYLDEAFEHALGRPLDVPEETANDQPR